MKGGIPLRRLFCWKTAFYDVLLPLLRSLGLSQADLILGKIGIVLAAVTPGRKARLVSALRRAALALDGSVASIERRWPDLASSSARFLARDILLDTRSDEEIYGRFDVKGRDRLYRALGQGRGAILVGSHFGAHLAGLHWLFRRGLPVRAMIQRPSHVSKALRRGFEEAKDPHPQTGLFLSRELSAEGAVERLLRARAVLRDGMALYLCGDIPWDGPNTRVGHLLGKTHGFLGIWPDLAALTGAPVFLVFCTHRPGGRFALEFEPMGTIRAGGEDTALGDYLRELQARIANDLPQAVAHLLWPCFETISTGRGGRWVGSRRRRPSRRNIHC